MNELDLLDETHKHTQELQSDKVIFFDGLHPIKE